MGLVSSKKITVMTGPTNTGKTFFAMKRMLGYRSGIIGFPLRLLARENYDKAVAIKGRNLCALVTGEEKILPPAARYFFCTVESMPLDRRVEFIAVDEIQICADPERGHIFTDRLLRLRGSEETLFMGSSSIKPIIRKLIKGADFIESPRFSRLSYGGVCRVDRVPPRSAVVAFSATDVYRTAEIMRQAKGGTAVVLGALSPRVRNAQVELFEKGDVDYMVASDAIGMGLNLQLDHVAFAGMTKYDGRVSRKLTADEVGQIAGRAGRHTRDGTFGATNEIGDMGAALIDRVENHAYDSLEKIYWRNPDLDFLSPRALLKSLEQKATDDALIRARPAEDYLSLAALATEESILRQAKGRSAVQLLWDVCQIPDFSQLLTGQHVRLLSTIYHHLIASQARLPEDWVANQIQRVDKTEGDIDGLIQRIASVRTWTYVSHRDSWLQDAAHWQGVTRAVEDRLSDALHDRLTQRFVDKRAATLVRGLRRGEAIVASVKTNGDIIVEGELLGRVEGFAFSLDAGLQSGDVKLALSAARKALLAEIPGRVVFLEQDNDGSFLLNDQGELTWRGIPIGKLARGNSPLKPLAELYDIEFLDFPLRKRVRLRLQAWLDRHLRAQLKPLFALMDGKLDALARGLAFQLCEEYACLNRNSVREVIKNLSKEWRKELSKLGVCIGRDFIFIPSLMRPGPSRLRALLWGCWHGTAIPALPDLESTAFDPGDDFGKDFCKAIGYNLITNQKGKRLALRVDVQERISHGAYKLLREKAGEGGPNAKHPIATAENSPLATKESASPKAPAPQIRSAEVNPEQSPAPEKEAPAPPTTGTPLSKGLTTEETPKEKAKAAPDNPNNNAAPARYEILKDSFQISDAMRNVSKLDDAQLAFVLKSLRFHPTRLKGGVTVFRQASPQKTRKGGKKSPRRSKQQSNEQARLSDSPFAILQNLKSKG